MDPGKPLSRIYTPENPQFDPDCLAPLEEWFSATRLYQGYQPVVFQGVTIVVPVRLKQSTKRGPPGSLLEVGCLGSTGIGEPSFGGKMAVSESWHPPPPIHGRLTYPNIGICHNLFGVNQVVLMFFFILIHRYMYIFLGS